MLPNNNVRMPMGRNARIMAKNGFSAKICAIMATQNEGYPPEGLFSGLTLSKGNTRQNLGQEQSRLINNLG